MHLDKGIVVCGPATHKTAKKRWYWDKWIVIHQSTKNTAFLLLICMKCKMRVNKAVIKTGLNYFHVFTPCALSPPINSSFNIMLLLRKSVNCMLIIISVSNCFGDWINEESNCCVTSGFHLITITHFWLCCLFIYRHDNCHKVWLGMQTRSVCIRTYMQQFNLLLLCTMLMFYMCYLYKCVCRYVFLWAMKFEK